MSRPQIVAAIKDAGFTLESLSETNGLSKSAISTGISKPWPQVEAIIARTIGISAQEIWPPRYDRAGMPIKRGKTKESKRLNKGRPPGRTRPGSSSPTRRAA
jgi:Ner family transcriptional regulator